MCPAMEAIVFQKTSPTFVSAQLDLVAQTVNKRVGWLFVENPDESRWFSDVLKFLNKNNVHKITPILEKSIPIPRPTTANITDVS